ncbi:hypothetical protein RclHR1_00690035 [Rhizophagus clarus]|uniref:Protein kinase domain-containing protein n=1 Tax=Rhizophagus clarus TaxID=94130 RepID=A0A2Z6S6T6_9GLOM|nr:hypothetical protein RclHR1_00690035 [Rhizophagus clarus]
MEKKSKNLWKDIDTDKYQHHVIISAIDLTNEDEDIVYIKNLEKRKQVYGICGECNEPGTVTTISDLGMCQPANKEQTVKEEGIYGVLPYVAPEVVRGRQYTKAADIYSFGYNE